MTQVDAVTGAFSYSGAAIARDLIQRGHQVRTLTGHPGRAPAGTPIEVRPLDFGDERDLAASLAGVQTLYNTYWVRFAHGAVSHEAAVANSRVLFAAAVTAGVQRIVHVSITNPSEDSPDPYFRGKAAVEQALAASGVPSYAIVRPAVLFGGDGVLLNNIAWLLRHLPVFAIGGRGDYRLRPSTLTTWPRSARTSAHSPGTSRSMPSARSRSPSASWSRRSRQPSAAGPCSCRLPAR